MNSRFFVSACQILFLPLLLSGCGTEPIRAPRSAEPSGTAKNEVPAGGTNSPREKPTNVGGGAVGKPEEGTTAAGESLADLEKQLSAKQKEVSDLQSRVALLRDKEKTAAGPRSIPSLRANLEVVRDKLKKNEEDIAAAQKTFGEAAYKKLDQLRKDRPKLEQEEFTLCANIASAESEAKISIQTPEQLFIGMPATAYPALGADKAFERTAARKWLAANVLNKTIEWKLKVNDVQVKGNDPFDVVICGYSGSRINIGPHFQFGTCELGGAQVRVLLTGVEHKDQLNYEPQSAIRFRCGDEDGRKLREFRGAEVTLQAMVRTAVVADTPPQDLKKGADDHVCILLEVWPPAVNGFYEGATKERLGAR